MRLGARTVLSAALAALVVPATASAALEARGSVEQVYATGLKGGATAELLSSSGSVLRTRKATALGGVLFRNVKPGAGYKVRADGTTSDALTVLTKSPTPPSTDVYKQEIPSDGYGYMTMRDGIKLAYSVHPPTDVSNTQGVDLPKSPVPQTYPTLIEYSGYGYANPSGPVSGIAAIANLMGFAVVDVNMRGTGCSGGAFDFFEWLQSLDGYDVIETVARQPWVANNKVGMLGISYGGISQLFTAQTQPPSLAAITPLSVIDQTATTLYPGGILNTGFAVAWSKEREREALPAGPKTGQPYAYKRIQEGDEVCKANQALHGEKANLTKKIRQNDHYVPKVADPVSPVTFVDKIKVPVFMACQSTDEQTGGHCPTLAENMTGTDKKWFTFTNGVHVDSLSPETYNRLYDFLSIYVARQAPAMNAAQVQASAPLVFQAAYGIDNLTLPPDPIQQEPTYAGAKAAFEKLKQVRILFDNGAGKEPGQPYPGYEQSFDRFPIPGTTGRSWYFGARGTLAPRPPAKATAARFTWNTAARPLTDFPPKLPTDSGENGLWTATPPYAWKAPPAGSAASFVSAPLTEDTTAIGFGAVEAWVKADKPVVDLQATITEVRPDGKETFVQGGWLRSHWRKLDPAKSTPLEPWPALRLKDRMPLPRGRFVKVTIPLYFENHGYRKGSRLRVTITAPNGDQPIWSFRETMPKRGGTAKVAIGASRTMPSRLLLPVVPGVEIPTPLPPCPGLRGEPCRQYTAYRNG